VRLLVAASGHDVHEVRNIANIALERTFAPKEFDAPLATKFINVNIGRTYRFSFEIPGAPADYHLRLYRNGSPGGLSLARDRFRRDTPRTRGKGNLYCGAPLRRVRAF
jgi:hypothetical protein